MATRVAARPAHWTGTSVVWQTSPAHRPKARSPNICPYTHPPPPPPPKKKKRDARSICLVALLPKTCNHTKADIHSLLYFLHFLYSCHIHACIHISMYTHTCIHNFHLCALHLKNRRPPSTGMCMYIYIYILDIDQNINIYIYTHIYI